MKLNIYLLLFGYVCSTAVIEEGTVYSGVIDQFASQKIKYMSTGGQKQIHYYQCTGSADLTIVDDAKQIDVESFKARLTKPWIDPVVTVKSDSKNCYGGQIATNCGSPCTRTCFNSDVMMCAAVCVEDTCQCPNSAPIWHKGSCITQKDCPSSDKCSGGQEMTSCGSACTITCDNPFPMCIEMCIMDICQCPSSKPVWHNQECIALEQCPKDGQLAEVNKKNICTEDTPKVECFAAPCDVTTCSNYPHALCVNDYCGGCNAVYSVQGEEVECDTYNDPDVTKGAAPNWSVGTYNAGNFTFWLLGKSSENDDINSYKIYLDNNSNAQYVVVAQDSEIVSKATTNSSVSLAWLEPTTVFTNIAKYCVFHKALALDEKLNGSWLACGHEVQSGAESSVCTTAASTEIQGLATNRSHYFWVVVYGENNSTTAYPFTRVDLRESYSGGVTMGIHVALLVISVLLWC